LITYRFLYDIIKGVYFSRSNIIKYLSKMNFNILILKTTSLHFLNIRVSRTTANHATRIFLPLRRDTFDILQNSFAHLICFFRWRRTVVNSCTLSTTINFIYQLIPQFYCGNQILRKCFIS
jgi:hypothetical protein